MWPIALACDDGAERTTVGMPTYAQCDASAVDVVSSAWPGTTCSVSGSEAAVSPAACAASVSERSPICGPVGRQLKTPVAGFPFVIRNRAPRGIFDVLSLITAPGVAVAADTVKVIFLPASTVST